MRMRVEVEYVRTETIEFDVDMENGWALACAPGEAGRVLREMHCQVHRGKNLALGEKPRILRFDVVPMTTCDYCGTAIEVTPGKSVFTKHPESPYNYFCSEEHRALKEGHLDDFS